MDGLTYLRGKKIKATKARIYIMGILLNSEIALSADYIYEKCLSDNISVDLSTVYRTLELLDEKGITEKFDLGDGRYNFIIKKEGHMHKIECSMCHKKLEIECPMNQIDELIRNKTGFTPMEHQLFIKGICEDCRKIRE
jgi:Fur family transcriptional regulator, ferric uptake regulator